MTREGAMGANEGKLLDDVCRCHDELCDERHQCARWVLREDGGPRTPHSWSLYPLPDGNGWGPQMVLDRSAPCPARIDNGNDGGAAWET